MIQISEKVILPIARRHTYLRQYHKHSFMANETKTCIKRETIQVPKEAMPIDIDVHLASFLPTRSAVVLAITRTARACNRPGFLAMSIPSFRILHLYCRAADYALRLHSVTLLSTESATTENIRCIGIFSGLIN